MKNERSEGKERQAGENEVSHAIMPPHLYTQIKKARGGEGPRGLENDPHLEHWEAAKRLIGGTGET